MSNQWPKVKLGDVLRRSEETIKPLADTEYREITVRLWGNGIVERSRVIGASLTGRRFVAHSGHFIVSRIDARNGAMGLVPESLESALVTNDFPLFNLNTELLEPAYLGWICRTMGFVDLCRSASEGTTNRVRLQEDRFHALEIPLPPLAEQQRVVAKIEELAAQIHEARTLRCQAAEEAEALITSSLGRAYQLCVDSFGNTAIGSFTKVIGGKRLPAGERLSDERTPFPYIRVSDMENHSVSLRNLKFVPERLQPGIARYIIRSTDVYVTIAGTIGYTGTIPDELDGANLTENAARLVFAKPTEIEKHFVVHMLRSPQIQGIFRQKRTVAAQPKLALHRISSTEIPRPPLPEQQRVVAKLDALQTKVDGVKRLQAETAAELDALLPSVLDKAFKGEL